MKGTSRAVNFGAGPAMLPDEVLQQIRDELMCLPHVGSSILEINHRGPAFLEILDETRRLLREVLSVPDSHEVLLLQGGSRLQFSVAPLNFSRPDRRAAYVVTGAWSRMAFDEAQRLTDAELIWSGESDGFRDAPPFRELAVNPDWSYLYFASNETIHGVQFRSLGTTASVPLICDMSSDFLSRPVRVSDYALLFACAQKNAGVAGLTIAIVDRDRLTDPPPRTPSYLVLKNQISSGSLFNTPPTFAIYVLKLMLHWLRDTFGDLAEVERRATEKSAVIYHAIDSHPAVYRGHAAPSARSNANITFFLPDDRSQKAFLESARNLGMTDLQGHRTVGGIRVSLYNAMPLEAVRQLADFMHEFAAKAPISDQRSATRS